MKGDLGFGFSAEDREEKQGENLRRKWMPSMELCERIPRRCFEDSMFEWGGIYLEGVERYPAPTVGEILAAFGTGKNRTAETHVTLGRVPGVDGAENGRWKAVWWLGVDNVNPPYEEMLEAYGATAEDAALALWLKWNEKEEREKNWTESMGR